MAASSIRCHPNFAVICSFVQRYGEQLRLPDLTIPELEEVLENTNCVGHGLKELIITLMRRVVNSIKPDKWQKHLSRLIENYHSPVDAWELQSLGFSLCKIETKLSVLKYLCETQFDDNPKFKNLVNKESPLEQKIKPIGRDKLGLVYWFQKDHNCNIRIYREEQDDVDDTSWQPVGKTRDDLAKLIADLKVAQGFKCPLDSLESSRSATPVLTNGEVIEPVKTESAGVAAVKEESGAVNGGVGEEGGVERPIKDEPEIKVEGGTENGEVKLEGTVELNTGAALDDSKCEENHKNIQNQEIPKEEGSIENTDITTQHDKNEVLADLDSTKDDDLVTTNLNEDLNIVKEKTGGAVDGNVDSPAKDQMKDESDSDELVIDEGKEKKDGDNEASKEGLRSDREEETNDEKVETSSRELRENEAGWSRRRLRTRKPPPKKEEEVVEEKPKQKPQVKKKSELTVGKKSSGKMRRKEESESEDEKKEDEIASEEEIKQDNSSDEDFIMKNRAPPVRKARTATKSKKKARTASKKVEELSDEPCIKCGNYNHPDQILMCDSCDAAYHTACLRPPLMYVPDGEWFCPTCEHITLLKNLQATLEVVDSELKVIWQKNQKEQHKYKWLLTEVCPANILPEDTSVLITTRIEKVEKPERTRPKPRQAARAYIDDPDEIEYIQRRSGRNRKQISYKFEEYDTAINTAINDEVEQKRIDVAQGVNVVYGQSRGKDMSTIEAAKWEEEELARKESNARKRKKKLTDLNDATTEEEEDESDEFKITNEIVSDDDFIADDIDASETEPEEEIYSGVSDGGSEYGKKKKKGSRKRKIRCRGKDFGSIRRSSRNLGKERTVYQDSSSESETERPRDAWRFTPIITARHQYIGDDDSSQEEDRRKRRRKEISSESGSGPSYGKSQRKGSVSPAAFDERRKKKRKQKKESSSSEEEEDDDGYVVPKRKFRIESDDESGDDSKKKEPEEKNDAGDGSDDNDRKEKGRKVRKTLRGMRTRVDYHKMAGGSSSEEGEPEGGKEENEGSEGKGSEPMESGLPIKGEDEIEEGGSSSEEGEPEGGKEETDGSEGKGSEPMESGLPIKGEDEIEEGQEKTQENRETINTKFGSSNLPAIKDDDSLSPISDLEDLKENGSFESDKLPAADIVRTDKKSQDDEDDLEGVTDIFDYLTKD